MSAPEAIMFTAIMLIALMTVFGAVWICIALGAQTGAPLMCFTIIGLIILQAKIEQ